MKEIKLIKIEGRITNLKITDSKIYPLKNIESQAAGTAMLGTLIGSTSLVTNAPIMMMASKGIKAKTFTCDVGDYHLIGQFTAVKFKENDSLVIVISEEKQECKNLVYSLLDPRSGLLYIMYDMGTSLKILYKLSIKYGFILFLIFMLLQIILLFWIQESFDLTNSKDYIIKASVVNAIGVIVIGYINIGNSIVKLSRFSETIFEKLGFDYVGDQDFQSGVLVDNTGIHKSVMKYRKNLKGKEPYPEDYFDKHPIDRK